MHLSLQRPEGVWLGGANSNPHSTNKYREKISCFGGRMYKCDAKSLFME